MANSAAACQRACEIENEFLCRFFIIFTSFQHIIINVIQPWSSSWWPGPTCTSAPPPAPSTTAGSTTWTTGPCLMVITSSWSSFSNFYQSSNWLKWTVLSIALCESCENKVWSGQLWQINSPPIFNENEPNFQWWCKNIKNFGKVIRFPNIMDKKWWK